MDRQYDPRRWFWKVTGQDPGIYDSEAQQYVQESDQRVVSFKQDTFTVQGITIQLTPTQIASEYELQEVLSKVGVPYLGSLGAKEEPQPRITKARCRITCTGQAVANAYPTALIFDSEQKDPLGFHSIDTNPERITVTESGLYLCLARVRVLENTARAGGVQNSGTRAAQLHKGFGGGSLDEPATRTGAALSGPTEFQVLDEIEFLSGDVLRLFFEQDCGGPINVQARLSIMRIE